MSTGMQSIEKMCCTAKWPSGHMPGVTRQSERHTLHNSTVWGIWVIKFMESKSQGLAARDGDGTRSHALDSTQRLQPSWAPQASLCAERSSPGQWSFPSKEDSLPHSPNKKGRGHRSLSSLTAAIRAGWPWEGSSFPWLQDHFWTGNFKTSFPRQRG